MEKIFWNVDTQYDFMRDDTDFKGKLPVPDARKIENNLAKLTGLAKENGIYVVNTADWHNKDSPEIAENPDFVNTFPPHCLKNTKGAEYVPATRPKNPYVVDWENQDLNLEEMAKKRNMVIYKDKFDVFAGNPHTNKIVENLNPNKAIVYGVATNVCVDQAVRGLLERNVEVYAVTDAMKELPNLPLPYENWKEKGVNLVTTQKILENKLI